ncbi:DUF3556 domain-containing protein [Nocardioides sp. NPDC051685]|uniref:DUF3556 domain-containing protein n=1 Tax=Nocardioides sp. NPDC051685 TaxID=3364334 RepID=UPI0037AE5511
MGFTTPNYPPINPKQFLAQPLMERMKLLTVFWVENGFGAPKIVYAMYLTKLLFFYAVGGVLVATLTSGLTPWAVSTWWNEPIVYQKAVLWTVLLESINVAGSWGPLAGKAKPMTGGIRFWLRPGTIRLRPWRLPFTAGDRRTWFDVGMYAALLLSLVTALALPGVVNSELANALPGANAGLVRPEVVLVPAVLLALIGLRDKIIFLGARGEQYLPAMLFFGLLPFVDMIIALKLLIITVWLGAGFSKFGKHFAHVVPPMVSNGPFVGSKRLKRAHYRDYPRDLGPSRVGSLLAHGGGTAVEIITPLVLLFSTNHWVTLAAIAVMVIFHLFITSLFPLAVPLEWNVLFAFATIFLFGGFPASDGYGVTDMSPPWLAVLIAAALLFFPVLGNFRPDLVSFLPAMRQYSGNWAAGMWAFAPGAEEKLYAVQRPVGNQIDQYQAIGVEPEWAEVSLQQGIAFRCMHTQGRGLVSILRRHLPDIDRRSLREGEFVCNSLVGFNFGDGHLHADNLIAAMQSQVGFKPGEVLIAWVESQPAHRSVQEYKLIDPALGVVERGTYRVADAAAEQPWLPNGPIPTQVTWTREPVDVGRESGATAP